MLILGLSRIQQEARPLNFFDVLGNVLPVSAPEPEAASSSNANSREPTALFHRSGLASTRILTQHKDGEGHISVKGGKEYADTIATNFGYLTATLSGKASQFENVIVTYHDVGMNHTLCWDRLFKHPRLAPLFSQFAIIHIDAPGHEEDAASLASFPKFEELALQVKKVVEHFKVKHFIGFGAGAGASILLQYAVNHPETVRGLALISLVASSESFGDRISGAVGGLISTHPQQMLARWFDSAWLEANKDQAEKWNKHACSLNQHNVQLFIQSFRNRPSLSSQLRLLPCRVLCFVGRKSSSHEQQLDTYGETNVKCASLIELESGGVLLHVEQPDEMVTPLLLFIDGFGVMHVSS